MLTFLFQILPKVMSDVKQIGDFEQRCQDFEVRVTTSILNRDVDIAFNVTKSPLKGPGHGR